MTDATHVLATPPTPRRDLSDLEDTLNRATNMASIAVTLMEGKVFDVYAHYGDKEYHERRRRESPGPYGTYTIHEQDVETFMWTIYELHAQIRSARDQFCGTDDDAPEQAKPFMARNPRRVATALPLAAQSGGNSRQARRPELK
jgi:hypothetical protein